MFLSDSSLDCFLWYSVCFSSIRRLFSFDLKRQFFSFSVSSLSFSVSSRIWILTASNSFSQETSSASRSPSFVFLSRSLFPSSAFLILICSIMVSKRCSLDWMPALLFKSSYSSFCPFSIPALHWAIFSCTSSRTAWAEVFCSITCFNCLL